MKVIFHINESGKWRTVLGNVKNMIETGHKLGENYEIEVLANGDAVLHMQENVSLSTMLYDKFSELSKQNVTFKACNNSLMSLCVGKSALLSFIEIVPAGVIELTKKQTEGFAYIKP